MGRMRCDYEDETAHMAEIAEKEARILERSRLLREETGHLQETGQGGGCQQRLARGMMRCAPAARDSRRQPIRGETSRCSRSATSACQGGVR